MKISFEFDEIFPKEITLNNKKIKIGLSKKEISQIYMNYVDKNYNEEIIKYKKDISKRTLKKPIILHGHSEKISSMVVSVDNMWLISGSYGGNLKVWDLETFKEVKNIQNPNKKAIWAVDISYGNRYIAYGGSDHTIKICEFSSQDKCVILEGHTNDITCLKFTRNCRYLVSGSIDRTIKIWDFRSGKLVKTLDGHDSTVRDIAISSDDEYIVSGGYDSKIKIWNLENAQLAHTFQGHTDNITSVKISSDDVYIISSGEDNKIKVWDFTDKKLAKTIGMNSKDETEKHKHNISLINSDNTYIVSSKGNIISIWDLKKTKLIKELEYHESEISSLLVSSDNNYIISSSEDHNIKISEFSHVPSPYQQINYKLFALIEYFTDKNEISNDNMPTLKIKEKGEFEKQWEYEARIEIEKENHQYELEDFHESNRKKIQQYANNIISTVYGLPYVMGEIRYNAEDEYFDIKVKFGNIRTIYKLILDIPIDIAPAFKKYINKVNIYTTFKRDGLSIKISRMIFIYNDIEYVARTP